MKIKFWGTRGSIATPEPQCMRYGGNTSCLEVRTAGGDLLIFDAGTGIRRLGAILEADGSWDGKGHLLFSHYHWDHIQGFPFFRPVFDPRREFRIYGPFKVDGRLFSSLEGQMGNHYFPVRLEELAARLDFVELIEQEFEIGDALIRTRALRHPQGCLGFRIADSSGVVAYVTDTEHLPGQLDRNVLELAESADLFIYDTMFLPEEFPRVLGWGHSTYEVGARLAREAGAKTLVLFHHDPMKDDEALDAVLARARDIFPDTIAATRDRVIELEEETEVRRLAKPESFSAILRQRFRIERNPPILKVKPSSFLEHFNSEEFRQQVVREIDSEIEEVVFDLATIDEFDPLSLGTLAQFIEQAKKVGAEVHLVTGDGSLRHVLQVARFDHVARIDGLEGARSQGK